MNVGKEIKNLISQLINTNENKLDKFTLRDIFQNSKALKLTREQGQKLELLKTIINEYNAALILNEEVLLDSSTKAGNYVAQLQKNNTEKEIFTVLLLNSHNQLIHKEAIFEGSLTEAAIYPREIIKLVLEWNAKSVVFTHNHPGGSLTPSQSDINTTQKLKSALNTIDVSLVDHIITNPSGEYNSMAEKGLI